MIDALFRRAHIRTACGALTQEIAPLPLARVTAVDKRLGGAFCLFVDVFVDEFADGRRNLYVPRTHDIYLRYTGTSWFSPGGISRAWSLCGMSGPGDPNFSHTKTHPFSAEEATRA